MKYSTRSSARPCQAQDFIPTCLTARLCAARLALGTSPRRFDERNLSVEKVNPDPYRNRPFNPVSLRHLHEASLTFGHRAIDNSNIMPSDTPASALSQLELLNKICNTLQSMQIDYQNLSAAVEIIEGRVNILAGVKQLHDAAESESRSINRASRSLSREGQLSSNTAAPLVSSPRLLASENTHESVPSEKHQLPARSSGPSTATRIILTTYPGQSGIDPLPMNWGHKDPMQRGPVVVSRSQSTIRRRNGTL